MTVKQAILIRKNDLPRVDRSNGAYSKRFVHWSCVLRSMINGITTIPPHEAISLHYHNCEESAPVPSGTGIAFIGETTLAVETGDVTWTPANLPCQFHNGSDSNNLRVFWTYASVGATRTIVETGETHLIGAEHKA